MYSTGKEEVGLFMLTIYLANSYLCPAQLKSILYSLFWPKQTKTNEQTKVPKRGKNHKQQQQKKNPKNITRKTHQKIQMFMK